MLSSNAHACRVASAQEADRVATRGWGLYLTTSSYYIEGSELCRSLV